MRLLRSADRLAEYDFGVHYKPGLENVVADVLSRSPAKPNSTDEPEPTEDIQTIFGAPTLSVISKKDLAAATSSDPIIQEALIYTIEGWTKPCSNHALKRYLPYGMNFQCSTELTSIEAKERLFHLLSDNRQ